MTTRRQSQPPALRTSKTMQEVRIDYLLEEELRCDLEFARRFLAECRSGLALQRVDEVIHSVVDKFGEADLVARLRVADPDRGSNIRLALLIEDKITTPLQPEQDERYRKRGEAGISEGLWDAFVTVLVAPASYLTRRHGFQAVIPLEKTKTWICESDPVRRAFKIAKIDEAIAKKNSNGVKVVDADMTRFRADYYRHLQEFNARRGTDFLMPPPKDSWYDDTWFIFKSSGLPAYAEIRHMARTGNVGLDFKNVNFARAAGLEELLEKGMTLVPIGTHKQHTTIRLPASPIAAFDDFRREQAKLEAALLDAEKIWRLYQRERSRFETILASARRAQ
jgi:hypothetical protein